RPHAAVTHGVRSLPAPCRLLAGSLPAPCRLLAGASSHARACPLPADQTASAAFGANAGAKSLPVIQQTFVEAQNSGLRSVRSRAVPGRPDQEPTRCSVVPDFFANARYAIQV